MSTKPLIPIDDQMSAATFWTDIIETHSTPGDVVLVPFADDVTIAGAALELGRRVILFVRTPAQRLRLWGRLAPPDDPSSRRALARLAATTKRDTLLDRHINSLYQTACLDCGKPAPATTFLWDPARQIPVAKELTCTACGFQGRAPADDADVKRAAHIERRGLSFWFILEWLVDAQDVSGREIARRYLDQYSPRNLAALADVTRKFMPFGTLILLFGGLMSTVSALNATTYSSTRVSFAMGRDQVLPAFFAKVHEKTRTPHIALFLTSALIIFMVIAIPIEDVAAAADVMFLLLFLQVNYAVMRIRDEFGDRLEYGYLMPFYPWVPIIGIVTKSFLAIYLYRFSPTAWFSAGLWIVAGLAIFFVYSRERLQESERPRIAYEMKRGPRKRQRILVPIADANHIETELTLAAALARKGSGENAEIIALNVIVIPPQLPLSEGEQYAAQAWPLLDQIHRFAERFDDMTVNTMVGIGHQISQVITNIAEREEAEYIVMGWKGTVHADRVRGSVAQAVLLGAPSDTIVIKDQGLPEKVEEILVAVAPRVHVSEALKAAADLADGFDARLRLISIATPRKHPRETPERLARWLEKIKNDLTAAGVPAGRIQMEVLEGESVEEMLVQEAEKSDLLVMGASRDWIVRQYLVGSFPDEIANRLATTTTVMVKKEEPRAISVWHRLVGLLPMR